MTTNHLINPESLPRHLRLKLKRERTRSQLGCVKDKVGVVYFLSGADMVKIGFTRDLSVRMNHLSNNSPVALVLLGTIEGGVQKEIEIQLQFSHIRSHGEWYRATPELLNFIEELTQ